LGSTNSYLGNNNIPGKHKKRSVLRPGSCLEEYLFRTFSKVDLLSIASPSLPISKI
jgi:hypothetical protein